MTVRKSRLARGIARAIADRRKRHETAPCLGRNRDVDIAAMWRGGVSRRGARPCRLLSGLVSHRALARAADSDPCFGNPHLSGPSPTDQTPPRRRRMAARRQRPQPASACVSARRDAAMRDSSPRMMHRGGADDSDGRETNAAYAALARRVACPAAPDAAMPTGCRTMMTCRPAAFVGAPRTGIQGGAMALSDSSRRRLAKRVPWDLMGSRCHAHVSPDPPVGPWGTSET